MSSRLSNALPSRPARAGANPLATLVAASLLSLCLLAPVAVFVLATPGASRNTLASACGDQAVACAPGMPATGRPAFPR